jgi:Ca-activated chloride channel family protein
VSALRFAKRFAPLPVLVAALVIVASTAVGCAGSTGSSNTLTVLAGSEVKDLAPLLPQIEKATGIKLTFDFTGTLDGTQQIIAGNDRHDLAWFSHSKYLYLLQREKGVKYVHAETPIMLSPVVLGVKHTVAEKLGWTGAKVTWRDVAEAAKAGKLRFAMTNPGASNSGFTALLGVASAFAGSADTLNAGQIDTAAMKELFAGQKLTAGSSGWLADAYVGAQSRLDGLVNYESVLLELNQAGTLHEKLDMIYPSEGIVTANYPLLLENEAKRAQYDELVKYLLSPEFQRSMMKQTLRRPATPGIPLDPRLPTRLLVELPFPSAVKTINQILFAYLNEARTPSHATFVLDVSGSMGDAGKIGKMKDALTGLTGIDTSLTGQFARFHNREQLTFIPFDNRVFPAENFTIEGTDVQSGTYPQIRRFVNGLRPGGNTAIYSALIEAYKQAAANQKADPNHYYSIVLMTDGENTAGESAEGFLDFYKGLPARVKQIRTFAVLFGDASQEQLNQIATTTGGKVFDARDANLSAVFKEIRGYQ